MDPITLKSGATLAVSIAPFTAGNRLMKAVARELSSVDFNLEVARELSSVDFNLDLKSFDELSDKDINVLKNVAFQTLQSDAIEAAVMECMKKCLYNEQRITEKTFEPEEARPDYLPVAWEVMKANLRPFFAGLDLSSLTSAKPTSSAPKPE